MLWHQTRVGFASSLRKRASNSCWKTLTFWRGKAERRNSSRRTHPAACQCSNFIPLRIGRHLSVLGGAPSRTEPLGAPLARTGGNREVESSHGTRIVRYDRTYFSEYQPNLS